MAINTVRNGSTDLTNRAKIRVDGIDLVATDDGATADSSTIATNLPFLNVRKFGAVGDGTTDDLPAFNAAIAAMGTANTPLGNTLLVPVGTYKLDGDLILNRNLILEGMTPGLRGSQCVLNFTEGHGVRVISTSEGGQLTGSGTRIKNLLIHSLGEGTGTSYFRRIAAGGLVRSSNTVTGTIASTCAANVGSISRSGTVVTVNTTGPHGLTNGDILKMSPGEANFSSGDKTVTVVTATRFTYVEAGSAVSNGTAQTFTLTHALSIGSVIRLAGDDIGADGNVKFTSGFKTIASVPTTTTFTYSETGSDATSTRDHTFLFTSRALCHGIDTRSTVRISDVYVTGFAGNGINIVASSNATAPTLMTAAAGNISRTSNVVTVTINSHGRSMGEVVTMYSSGEADFPNGDKTITGVTTNTFTYSETGSNATTVAAQHFTFPAWGTPTGGTPYGNANCWFMDAVWSENNLWYGCYVAADDANAGLALGVSCLSNGLGAFVDTSFLGCTYIGCHAAYSLDEYNAPGTGYWIEGGVNFTFLLGCYCEADMRPGCLDGSAWALGGDLAATAFLETGYTAGFDRTMRSGFSARSWATCVGALSITANDGPTWRKLLLGNPQGQRVMGFHAVEDSETIDVKYGSARTGWWEWCRQSVVYLAMSDSTASDGANRLSFPNGYYLGGSGVGAPNRARLLRSAAPAGTFVNGDRVETSGPSLVNPGTANEYTLLGWTCTTGGASPTWAAQCIYTEPAMAARSTEQSITYSSGTLTLNPLNGETISVTLNASAGTVSMPNGAAMNG